MFLVCRVEQQGARSAPGPRASGDWVCDVRYMGARQGHRGTAQLEWTVERETRARGMPDIQVCVNTDTHTRAPPGAHTHTHEKSLQTACMST